MLLHKDTQLQELRTQYEALEAQVEPPPEMESWLKMAKLGPYDTGEENWDEIVKKATEEGEVIVYTSSGRIQKLVKPFAKVHPGIKLTVHDLGSTRGCAVLQFSGCSCV